MPCGTGQKNEKKDSIHGMHSVNKKTPLRKRKAALSPPQLNLNQPRNSKKVTKMNIDSSRERVNPIDATQSPCSIKCLNRQEESRHQWHPELGPTMQDMILDNLVGDLTASCSEILDSLTRSVYLPDEEFSLGDPNATFDGFTEEDIDLICDMGKLEDNGKKRTKKNLRDSDYPILKIASANPSVNTSKPEQHIDSNTTIPSSPVPRSHLPSHSSYFPVNNPSVISPKKNSTSKRRVCSFPHCTNRARAHQRCKKHGGARSCTYEGCTKNSQSRGLCIAHGGGSRCKFSGCTRASQSRGLCKSHGGGKFCVVAGCVKKAHLRQLCRMHGGGERCRYLQCPKWAQRKGWCMSHAKQLLGG